MKTDTDFRSTKDVWIVFSDHTELKCLKFLRRGFRHCFALINDGRHWISIDPLSNYMDVNVSHIPAHADLPAWFKAQGHEIVVAKMDQTKQKMAPVLPFTCVEALKRLLGIHSMRIWTPYQLYTFLKHQA